MRIENNAQTLDQEIARLTNSVGSIATIKQGLDKELDKLYSSGFKDRKFEELKGKVKESESSIIEINKILQDMINSLKQRSQLIKTYHNVRI